METVLAEASDVSEAIAGAKIQSLSMTEDGLHIVLEDGRTLVIPDAQIVAVCASRYFWN